LLKILVTGQSLRAGRFQVIGKLEVLVIPITLSGIHPQQHIFIGLLLFKIILNE
jgi:hypothetical protein